MAKKTAINPEVKKEIDRYIQNLKNNKLHIKKAILFGSFVKGEERKWSDIDLCIVSPDFNNPREASEFLWKHRDIKNLRYVIEPIGFSEKDFSGNNGFLIENIKKAGVEMDV